MDSLVSNVNSDGVPVDHDGNPLESVLCDGLGTFAVSGSVFQELLRDHSEDEVVEDLNKPNGKKGCISGTNTRQSYLGAIPVVVTDDDNSSEEEPPFSDNEIEALERITVNPVAKAAFAINRNEREELFALRKKMMVLNSSLKKRGISMVELEKEGLNRDAGFNVGLSTGFINGRDEFGLPVFNNDTETAPKSFAGRPERTTEATSLSPKTCRDSMDGINEGAAGSKSKVGCEDPLNPKLKESSQPFGSKSWSTIVKEPPPSEVSFEYVPLEKGSSVISPPDEELLAGNDKFKNCIVGTFSKKAPPYHVVVEFAKNAWSKKGPCLVAQKSSSTFLFNFENSTIMNSYLSRGTWYVEGKPMLVKAWGKTEDTNVVKNIPLWVKISNIPDSYWTAKGLSRLASVVGPPLCADPLTSKLKVLPFAKVCVNHSLGDSLPNSVQVLSIDPLSGDKVTSEVLFSYPNKPLMCSGCNSLGHTVGACPTATRIWVPKSRPKEASEEMGVSIDEKVEVPFKPDNVEPVVPGLVTDPPPAPVEDLTTGKEGEDWHTVKKKTKLTVGESSFASKGPLPIYNSISRALSKNQKKHGNKPRGRGSSL
ncbi:hypothetical protein POM88_054587 [Heracleum sosnowskyi]|uniref:DUF4283 domain-containing protein n=1 Tax=Heracleum sosnowskyi TaxID=360622 RepID=A0AAD8LW16_9APIA|nr:hypothetical protein POM88_054587 [Heracleum sosnowskyi]